MNAGVVLVVWLLCGAGCAMIAHSKNRSVGGFFLLGLLLGLVGVIIAACVSTQQAQQTAYRAPLATAAGWFPDPYGSTAGTLRWFDGRQWGSQTKPAL